MSTAFNIPKSTSTGQANNVGGIPNHLLKDGNDKKGNDQLTSQLKYMLPPEKKATTDKALDLSGGGYGTGTNKKNELRKFHQVTMYFHPYKPEDPSKAGIAMGTKRNGTATGNTARYTITSNLPDQLQYKVGGQWNKPLDWTADATVDLLLRTYSEEHKSLRTMASTGLIWTAPDPLEITFTIHAFDDTASDSHINIQECLQVLGAYTLPAEGKSVYTDVPSGVDLGLTIKRKAGQKGENRDINTGKSVTKESASGTTHSTGGKNIDILFGGMLYLQRVSIKNFTVNYTNTKNMLLHYWGQGTNHVNGQRLLPMTADITITITTVRGLSALNYSQMLMLGTKDNDTITAQKADEAILGELDLSAFA